MTKLAGVIESVTQTTLGSQLDADAALGDGSVFVVDLSDFDEAGGTLTLGGVNYDYTSVDEDTGEIVLAATLAAVASDGDRVDLYDPSTGEAAVETTAQVALPGADYNDDAIEAFVAHSLVPLVPLGIREPGKGEAVQIEEQGDGEWTVVDVRGKRPVIQPDYLPAAPVATPVGSLEQLDLTSHSGSFTFDPSTAGTTIGDASALAYDDGTGFGAEVGIRIGAIGWYEATGVISVSATNTQLILLRVNSPEGLGPAGTQYMPPGLTGSKELSASTTFYVDTVPSYVQGNVTNPGGATIGSATLTVIKWS